jgi:signal transduction histidine kinase
VQQRVVPPTQGQGKYAQKWRSQREQEIRQEIATNTLNYDNDSAPYLSDVHESSVTPVWMGDTLLLARRVRVNGDEYVQGCQLDWPALRTWLTGMVGDLLPEARLEPVAAGPTPDDTRMLASLPLRLIPGEVPVYPAQAVTPLRLSLIVAWACVVLAALAVAVLLVGVVSLSERRAAFVSAVTHEMRTPLTTFRMYTEMLSRGMVPEESRRRYLDTLRVEADRLSHLIANVLAFARLERNGAAARREALSLAKLLERIRPRLAERASLASMELAAQDNLDPGDQVRVDPAALEQILFNLVDNACKYACDAGDRRIHLEACTNQGHAVLRVCDHGPGIAPPEYRRLFRPFCKSASDAANSAPGVGLGLALSRRLARSMGGNLRLNENAHDGACFEVVIPLAKEE